jgi:hypothetical protein
MSTDGITFELGAETIIPIIYFLILGGVIIAVSDPNFLKSNITASENSYAASQISNSNIILEIQYEEGIKVSEENNEIVVQIDKSEPSRKAYFGGDIDITQDGNIITMKTSNKVSE